MERYPDATFFIFISARGPGKTYSTLKYALDEQMYLVYFRRTLDELQRCTSEQYNPYKPINIDTGSDVHFKTTKTDAFIYSESTDNIIGSAAAMSTFDNARGISVPECKLIFYDEFIRKPAQRKIRGEADIFFNAYESINRNKELLGEPAVKCVLASNAVNLDSEILAEFNIVHDIEVMISTGQELKYYPDKGIVVCLPKCKAFREQKENTALYRATRGTKYEAHALNNEFTYNDFSGITQVKAISEYLCLCSIEDIYIYKHKSRKEFYACQVRADSIRFTERSLIQFMRHYGIMLREEYFSGNLYFSDYQTKNRLTEYLKV